MKSESLQWTDWLVRCAGTDVDQVVDEYLRLCLHYDLGPTVLLLCYAQLSEFPAPWQTLYAGGILLCSNTPQVAWAVSPVAPTGSPDAFYSTALSYPGATLDRPIVEQSRICAIDLERRVRSELSNPIRLQAQVKFLSSRNVLVTNQGSMQFPEGWPCAPWNGACLWRGLLPLLLWHQDGPGNWFDEVMPEGWSPLGHYSERFVIPPIRVHIPTPPTMDEDE